MALAFVFDSIQSELSNLCFTDALSFLTNTGNSVDNLGSACLSTYILLNSSPK